MKMSLSYRWDLDHLMYKQIASFCTLHTTLKNLFIKILNLKIKKSGLDGSLTLPFTLRWKKTKFKFTLNLLITIFLDENNAFRSRISLQFMGIQTNLTQTPPNQKRKVFHEYLKFKLFKRINDFWFIYFGSSVRKSMMKEC